MCHRVRRAMLMIGLSCGLFHVPASHAQEVESAPKDRWVEHIRAEWTALQLTDEQQTKLTAILDDASTRVAALAKDSGKLSPAERQAKTSAFRATVLPKVMALLTEEQKQALRQYRAKRGAEIFVRAYRTALDSIDMTEQQRAKVAACLEASQANFESAFLKLPIEGRPSDADRAPLMAAMKDFRRKLNEILTPDQREKLIEMMGPDDLP